MGVFILPTGLHAYSSLSLKKSQNARLGIVHDNNLREEDHHLFSGQLGHPFIISNSI
uniref:Uncharacterized protein n=1 Tax=Nelumbo nucifera TaxID=4432 RepID=A0A822XX46_NELNU|nr:TPA_asm: hypothetical protein HUJ06_026046 [Nelumbo nucifera]